MNEMPDSMDANVQVIGQVMRAEAWEKCLSVRVIRAFVVDCGEACCEAFRREAREELNLDADALAWCEVAYFSPCSTDLSAFMRMYKISLKDTPNDDRDNVSESFRLEPRDGIWNINKEPANGVYSSISSACEPKENVHE